jgi:hypothetical protein
VTGCLDVTAEMIRFGCKRFVQVLALLQRLTNALGLSSVRMQPFVLPLLDYALNIEGPEALNLLEDALLLWLVTLRNAPSESREALQLWPHWIAVMRTSLEHVSTCMLIACSCVLLGKVDFLKVSYISHVSIRLVTLTALLTVFRPPELRFWTLAAGR